MRPPLNIWRGSHLEVVNALAARATLAAPLGLHGDEAVHVVLVLGLVRVPDFRARQTAPRHTAGEARLRAAPECGRRQRNSLTAHLIHPRRVGNPWQSTLKREGTSVLVHLLLLVHLFRRGPALSAQNPFQFLTVVSYQRVGHSQLAEHEQTTNHYCILVIRGHRTL